MARTTTPKRRARKSTPKPVKTGPTSISLPPAGTGNKSELAGPDYETWRRYAVAYAEGHDEVRNGAPSRALLESSQTLLNRTPATWKDAAILSEIAGFYAEKNGGNEFYSLRIFGLNSEDDLFLKGRLQAGVFGQGVEPVGWLPRASR